MFFFFISVFTFEWTTFWIACPFIDKLKTTNFSVDLRLTDQKYEEILNVRIYEAANMKEKPTEKFSVGLKNKWQTGFNLKNLFIASWFSGAF